jgi:hypothetical protein
MTKKISMFLRKNSRFEVLILILLLSFLILRNWSVFLLPDINEGSIIKGQIVVHGFGAEGFGWYVDNYVLKPYNNAFQPVWFLIFYLLALFDNNPWITGMLSFSIASIVLFLIYKILAHLYGNLANSRMYAVGAALVFSSTIFFLEIIAWKWMTLLLITTASFLFCFYSLLSDDTPSLVRRIAYPIILLAGIWSFGTGWALACGLVLFLILKKYFVASSSSHYLASTVFIAALGTFIAYLANSDNVSGLNLFFIAVHLPAMAAVVATNCLIAFSGVFRFTSIDPILFKYSALTGAAVTLAIALHFLPKLRRRRLTIREAAVLSFIFCYFAMLALSLMRIMPSAGLTPISSIENYAIGNRYLFVFSVPLFMALAASFGGYFFKLKREQVIIALTCVALLGIVTNFIYPKTDKSIPNNDRKVFYSKTIPALRAAEQNNIKLPNVTSDLLFTDFQLKLSDAVAIRKESVEYEVDIIMPEKMQKSDCEQIRKNPDIRTWLDSYNSNYCVNPKG